MQQDTIVKICILGESAVGKTSILYQYVYKKFNQNSKPTIGCDFNTKINSTRDNKPVRMQMWDIAGQQKFNSISKMYIRGALGIIIVSSAIDEHSLKQTLKWKKIIDQNCQQVEGTTNNIPILLVQNKIDLLTSQLQQYQTKQYLKQFAKTNGFYDVCCTSAKTNTNIQICFHNILDEICSRNLIKYVQEQAECKENALHKLKLNKVKQGDQKQKKCC